MGEDLMFTHVFVGANDLEASRRFYDPVLGALGHENAAPEDEARCVYRSDTGAFIVARPADGAPARPANGATLGFKAATSAEVDAFHAAGMANGGTDEGAPGPRFLPHSYGAYLRDPAGNKICAFSFDQP
jgi:catechol 2,3-dioxygenase-like lactoylglutathione lyase family enzyme